MTDKKCECITPEEFRRSQLAVALALGMVLVIIALFLESTLLAMGISATVMVLLGAPLIEEAFKGAPIWGTRTVKLTVIVWLAVSIMFGLAELFVHSIPALSQNAILISITPLVHPLLTFPIALGNIHVIQKGETWKDNKHILLLTYAAAVAFHAGYNYAVITMT